MKIRKGQLKDAKPLLKVMNQTKELQASAEGGTYNLNWIKDAISSKKTDLVLICEENKKIIGFLLAELHTKKGFSYLDDIYVNPKYRKKGIAAKLQKNHEKICKKLKIKQIMMTVLTTNKKMHQWSKKQGFKRGNKFYLYQKFL